MTIEVKHEVPGVQVKAEIRSTNSALHGVMSDNSVQIREQLDYLIAKFAMDVSTFLNAELGRKLG